VETVGEREREAAGRANTMTAACCVDCGLKLTGRFCGKCGRYYDMQEPEDDDDDSEEDEEGVEEEGLHTFILRR
jgi:hypothetical protein